MSATRQDAAGFVPSMHAQVDTRGQEAGEAEASGFTASPALRTLEAAEAHVLGRLCAGSDLTTSDLCSDWDGARSSIYNAVRNLWVQQRVRVVGRHPEHRQARIYRITAGGFDLLVKGEMADA